MDAARLEEVMKVALPRERILGLARETGVLRRQGLVEIDVLVNALVLTARTPAGGRQADVMRAYVKSAGVEPVRAAFYARFNTALEALVERMLANSLLETASDQILLPPALSCVHDWLAVDSETVLLHPSLKAKYTGTGDYAAVKVHKVYSLGRHNMLSYAFSPARDHDSLHLDVREAHRGHGLLMDLAYASHDRLRDCIRHDVRFVVKLKNGWKASLSDVHVGDVEELLVGTNFAEAIRFGSLRCENGIIDADVTLSLSRRPYPARLVAVETPEKGLCIFLTNVERERVGARLVGDLYRLRWEIEKSNKLDKSDQSLDDLDARKVCSAHTMLMASLLGSCIVGRLVHADHLALARAPGPLTRGPIHARALAMALAACHSLVTSALQSDDDDRPAAWAKCARKLAHLARDPNWRRRPSVFDTLLGFVGTPGRPRRQKAISRHDEAGGSDHVAATK